MRAALNTAILHRVGTPLSSVRSSRPQVSVIPKAVSFQMKQESKSEAGRKYLKAEAVEMDTGTNSQKQKQEQNLSEQGCV